ncbi:MAG: hypothetical protein AAGA77_24035, partial [Bacteroidota bacterium]
MDTECNVILYISILITIVVYVFFPIIFDWFYWGFEINPSQNALLVAGTVLDVFAIILLYIELYRKALSKRIQRSLVFYESKSKYVQSKLSDKIDVILSFMDFKNDSYRAFGLL